MSTRSAIARPQGEGFVGRYHHWDGYPTAMGPTLFDLRNGFFGGDTEALLKVLIDDHPAGWSSINGKDFSRQPGFREYGSSLVPCIAVIDGVKCGKGSNDHYCQYQKKHKKANPCGPGYGNHLGHAYEEDRAIVADLALTPECYCHGERSESEWLVTAENASGSGCEFAYVIEGARMLVLGSYHEDGGKAVGMFGMGDPEASWKILADVNLDGPEPDWEAIERIAWPRDDEEEAIA